MNAADQLFLQAVAAGLHNQQVDWSGPMTQQDWEGVFRMAEAHRMLPMVYQAVYACPAAAQVERRLMTYYRNCSLQMVALQTWKTAEFHPLLRALREAGVDPLVVKGITCRELYPHPDHRLSSDEDVLIPPEQFETCHRVMTEYGLCTQDPASQDYEMGYVRKDHSLYVEIHRSLFPEESTAYGDMNRFFRDIRSRTVEQKGIPTLHPTDHMLYLLCHAFKHFLHSGFGLRQVCDMILYANAYGSQIDWPYVLTCCREIRAEQFAAALFRIGWKYLGFSLEDSHYPVAWQVIYVDETALLEDILLSGVYGNADEDRLHSSTLTLQAVSSQKKGKNTTPSILKTLFPSARDMEGKYPYLKDKPILLPIAWTDRIVKYTKSAANPSDSLKIAGNRIQLLQKYGILDE